MNVLCIGDIVGKPGREALKGILKTIKSEHAIDFVVVNAENAAGGAGLTPRLAEEIKSLGCDVLTLGDHTWDQKDIQPFLEETDYVIRPANFPEETPGKGYCIKETKDGVKVGVVNLLGRVFMRYHVACPFRALEKIVEEIHEQTPIVIVDMHAETTSEKIAIGHFINGRASVLFGTHTHIQTADEKILSDGTAYITDLGMTGPYDSVIGQDKRAVLDRFLTSMPLRFHVASGDILVCGIVVEIDQNTGKATAVKRLQVPFQNI